MSILQRLKNYHPKIRNSIILLVIAVKVLIWDQFSKLSVYEYFRHTTEHHDVTSFFKIVEVYNKGISFGMFGQLEYSNIIFTALTTMICLGIIWYFVKNNNIFFALSFGLVIGGAIGNLIDRFTYGGVLDFLLFHYKEWSYPAFNIADAAIVFGVVLYIISSMKFVKSEH